MSDKIQAIRGMNDILPSESLMWSYVEHTLKSIAASYAYQEIRLPLVEHTSLFKRSIGEVTDIVEKEMYTFNDLNGDSLTLRPEGTAGCVRACIEHSLLHNQQQKLWYLGPMFRHERPQKGRYRQFYQFGVETFGYSGFAIELEVLSLCHALMKSLQLLPHVTLEINSLGTAQERLNYREKLIAYFKAHESSLDEDSLKRLTRNPLRILDSKNQAMQPLIQNAPTLLESLGSESLESFNGLCEGLKALGIEFSINPRLVRGLDYYSHTVFEWVTDKLGSQATVLAGGRYDALVAQLGGQDTPAFGFALGIERLILMLETLNTVPACNLPLDVFCIADSNASLVVALQLAETLRQVCDLNVFVQTQVQSFKSQFKKADKSGARFALVIGENELNTNTVVIKSLREQNEQCILAQKELCSFFTKSQ